MTFSQRTDYVQQAEARLPRVFRDKPRLYAMLAAFAEGAQDFEAHAFGMYVPRFLSNAAGATLDLYGALVGQARFGMDDTSYRLRIRARMALNRSSGTIPDLIRIAQLLVPDNTVLLRESYPAALLMQIADGPTPLLEDVYQILYSAKAAGVSFRLTTQDGPDAERFVFSGGVGLGYGGYATDWVGDELQTQQGRTAPTLGAVVEVVNVGGGNAPVASLTNPSAVPLGLGTVTLVVSGGNFTWTAAGGARGNAAGQVRLPEDEPGALLDTTGGAGNIGISVSWSDGDPYTTGDSWSFTVTDGTLTDSTAPVVTASGALTETATGKWTFTVTEGAPGYRFTYTRPDGTASASTAMTRGTPIALTDGFLEAVGLSVTWPNVTDYYVGAKHTVRAHAADATVGGRWVDVR